MVVGGGREHSAFCSFSSAEVRQRGVEGFAALRLYLLNSRRLVPCTVGCSASKSKQWRAPAHTNTHPHTPTHERMHANTTLTTGLICRD